jgi:structure-specific endonuclease subunit SLX1
MSSPVPSYVYLLESTTGATYVGATVDLNRRLRQHNKEIKGGAHATGSRVSRGESWHRVAYVSGFPDWQAALQFEWRWKNLSRLKAYRNVKAPLERRLIALNHLLSLPKSTEKATAFHLWTHPPCVHFENPNTFLALTHISTRQSTK